jgi:hypothetical protein
MFRKGSSFCFWVKIAIFVYEKTMFPCLLMFAMCLAYPRAKEEKELAYRGKRKCTELHLD